MTHATGPSAGVQEFAPAMTAGDRSMIDQFEAMARDRRDAIAITAIPDTEAGTAETDPHVSYGLLRRLSHQGARRLRARGVEAESLVGIVVDHDLHTMVAILSVMRAGACFLPIDRELPPARLTRILRESRPVCLLVPERHRARYAASGIESIALDDLLRPDARADTRGSHHVHPAQAAYVIYTSGSTGEPKGVIVTHGGLANHGAAFADIVGLSPDDGVLQFANLAFDAAYEEVLPCLCRGGRLVLRSAEMGADVVALLRRCEEQQVTLIDIPTALWHAMTPMLRNGLTLPASIRCVVIGGEEALAAHLADWQRLAAPGLCLLNTYGPTETTIIATAIDLLGRTLVPGEVPLGTSLRGTAVRLHDGEIFIAGAGVARGYLQAPRLTAERFVPDAGDGDAGGSDGGRAYRTGDQAVMTAAGDLIFKGRHDNQVKLHAHRIQLEEVEATLLAHPAIAACCVLVRDNRAGGKHLVAYCILHKDERALPSQQIPVSVMALREFIRERLPQYMVPAEFSFLEKFLLTPSGKIDRAKLPQIGHLDRKLRQLPEYERPRPGLETRLAAIWCEVLDLDVHEISAEDPFEFLGGNSLYSIQVRYKAHDAGLLFRASDLHLRQTIRGLAARSQQKADPWRRVQHALVDYANYCRGIGRVVGAELVRPLTARRAWREARNREIVARFYAGLRDREGIVYLFFTRHQLHWLATTTSFVPSTCNLVLIGGGLSADEAAWVRRRTSRPFVQIGAEVDVNMMWDILFAINTANFGWLDVDTLIMNPAIFDEMQRLQPDEAISCLWTHAACGPTKRPFHAIETYCLFFNIAVIDHLRAAGLLPRPSARTATVAQLELVKQLIPADEEKQAHFSTLSGRAFTHRLLQFDYDPLILFQLVANASGFKLNRVRFFTEIDTFNPYNYYSDEAIHVFPSIRGYDQLPWTGFEQMVRLATDYLVMLSMLPELPPSYQARRQFLESKFHHFNFNLDDVRREIRVYLEERGVSERTFIREQFRWLTADVSRWLEPDHAALDRSVAAVS